VGSSRMTARRRSTLATLTGAVANMGIVSVQAVILIPLYLRAVGVRLYGAWLGSGDLLVWVQAFDLGLPNLMIQRIGAAHARNDWRAIGEWLAGGTLVLGVVGGVLMVAGMALAPLLPALMHVRGQEAAQLEACFSLGAVAAAMLLFNSVFVGFSRGIQETRAMNVLLVVSGLAALLVSLLLVTTGFGLWAVPLGMLARAALMLTGSVVIVFRCLPSEARRRLRPSWGVLRELAAVAPATALGGVGYSLMTQSETVVVATVIGPGVAACYALTRKAADVARGLLDMIAFAAYGPFAHLVGSGNRPRALEVYQQLSSARLSASLALASSFCLVNASLLGVWVGPQQYGGSRLTALFALQLVVSGSAFLANYLYRATGAVARGSWALLAESLIRLPMMFVLARWLGAAGVPVAALLTAGVFGLVAHCWVLRDLGAASTRPSRWGLWGLRGVVVVAGPLAGAFLELSSWAAVLGVATVAALGFGALLLVADARGRALLVETLAGLRAGTGRGLRSAL
jgi:O-antigen/teichoic acid export membrane protein